MKKLIYADTFSKGAYHETFNASSLKMFSEIYDEVTYISTKSSRRVVENILKGLPNNIKWHRIFLSSLKSCMGNFVRHSLSSFWNVLILLLVPKDTTVFFNSNSLWFLSMINKIIRWRKINTIIMCHGEIEYIVTGQRMNRFSVKGLRLFVNSHFKPAKTLHFCVLGKSIYQNLKGVVTDAVIDKTIYFEHTFIPRNSVTISPPDNIIRIGTIGTIRPEKGLEQIIQFGKAIKPIAEMEFYALGKVICDIKDLNAVNIKTIPGSDKEYIARDEFQSYIDKMDYLVFMYPTDKYKLTASGALFDAIDSEKPILSLHNDYFDTMFKRANLGKQFDSLDEMICYIKNLGGKNILDIDFKENKRKFSPEFEAKEQKFF